MTEKIKFRKTEDFLDRIKIDLIKIIYSEQNNFDCKEFQELSYEVAIQLLKQLKEFRENYTYRFPKFVLHSTKEQFESCCQCLKQGYTLLQTEEHFLNCLKNEKQKIY